MSVGEMYNQKATYLKQRKTLSYYITLRIRQTNIIKSSTCLSKSLTEEIKILTEYRFSRKNSDAN